MFDLVKRAGPLEYNVFIRFYIVDASYQAFFVMRVGSGDLNAGLIDVEIAAF
ncbi:hypothetical protein C8J44_0238 [Sphingomonas sp. PP-CE-3A-406]|uniref:hypothetical protein n=1 Tax=Sphingomonas sp. PP-CE-3A-406 TaxID=2135659 RepID=UPI000F100C7D|nr:hypothetical protein [Sphingomonas sp. PP-CE-3A-406]RMB55005.1 hypothetical protein C8J44_0238 [Sphingomonas sp. PP-CE-3A-406]